jgi:hypothetical protein
MRKETRQATHQRDALTGPWEPAGSLTHRAARVAAGLRSAARSEGVELTDSFASKR